MDHLDQSCPVLVTTNVSFIICATQILEDGVKRPEEFNSLSTFDRNDFLLSDEEAHNLLDLPFPIGLCDGMKNTNFIQLLIRECNGHINALRTSVDVVWSCFAKDPAPSKSELTAYYLSEDFLKQMTRCFGCGHMSPKSLELEQFLKKCLAATPNEPLLKWELTLDEIRCFEDLKEAGILIDEPGGFASFSSPLT